MVSFAALFLGCHCFLWSGNTLASWHADFNVGHYCSSFHNLGSTNFGHLTSLEMGHPAGFEASHCLLTIVNHVGWFWIWLAGLEMGWVANQAVTNVHKHTGLHTCTCSTVWGRWLCMRLLLQCPLWMLKWSPLPDKTHQPITRQTLELSIYHNWKVCTLHDKIQPLYFCCCVSCVFCCKALVLYMYMVCTLWVKFCTVLINYYM